MLYHPISGFYPRQDIPGTYVCTAAFNKMFELLHFTLVPKVSASAPVKQSAEEDLEWLFNSFKLGQSNRIHLSTKRPGTYSFSSEKRKTTAAPQKLSTIWKRPSEEDNEDGDVEQASIQSSPSRPGVSTYRPVYVLFAEDLDKLQKTTERPSASSASASGSASGSASEESEEEETEAEVEAEESFEKTFEDKEPPHQYHFDAQNQENPPILLQQLLASTKRPSPTPPVSMRPSLHHQYATTYLPFLNFLNSESAAVQYKPFRNPGSPFLTRRTTTARPQTQPFQGHIVYDLQTNKLVLHNANGGTITRPTTERPTTRRPTTRFKIPSLPTERWPSSSKKTRPTPKTTTTTTTPPPPLIPDSVVCINSPCGANAKCFANTVYYHRQKETRREPACKCIDNYHGNPYLECRPPSPEETDYISFNSTGLFNKRSGQPTPTIALEELEEGHLQNSDVFHSNEPVIVDMRKK
ncbi:unnamed protein product [Orchesella dallaii]|uniref:Uncharacterized protein n=1 Tax=Orchesella dallaii TaxID=48710 RepID=A0ABP1S385_9HEXA